MLSKKIQYDVMIVGAGPGGCAAAIYLAQMGWQVLLLEKARFPRDKVCGDFISPRSQRVLETLGCKQALEESQPNRLHSASVYLDGSLITAGSIPKREDLNNYGYVSPRFTFDEILFRRAQEVGAVTIEGCEVKALAVHSQGVTLEARQDNIPCSFEGQLVIAADGAHSTIARLLGSENRSSKNTIVALRAYFDGIEGNEESADIFFDQSYFPGYAWIFPMGGGRANVGLGVVMDVYQRYDLNLRESFAHWIERDPFAQARLGNAKIDGRVVGWPLNTYRAKGGNYSERVLLLGDSACLVDPINGEGIHTALESARIAAQVANEALFTRDCSAAFLSRYERRWRAAFDLDMRTADLLVTIIKNRSLNDLWMLALKMIGQKALDDRRSADIFGGILVGVVPTHHGLAPALLLKTLLQNPAFWQKNLGLSFAQGMPGLLDSGLQLAQNSLQAASQIARQPSQHVEWGLDVASKSRDLLGCLGKTYSDALVTRMFNDFLRTWLLSLSSRVGRSQDSTGGLL